MSAPDDMLAPFKETPGDPFDLRKAGHLLRRAAFGGSLAERRRLVKVGVAAAVDGLFGPGAGEPVDELFEPVLATGDIQKVRHYRVWRLCAGPERLRERMSYFWHLHFATSDVKVQNAQWMARQWALFDELGLGRFDDLLLAVSRDPAMLRWLDNESNVKGAPNENYAREIFELFALGRGNYTEQDIREAARAFTGWHIRDQRFHLARRHHDAGIKTVFGQRGSLGGEDVVEITARRPESARFVAHELLAFFVHPEPRPDEVKALARCYTGQGRDIGRTLRVLLRSRLFYSGRAWRSRIKDPVDLVVGTVRSLGARAAPARLSRAAGSMGQTLCEPPSVEGWHGERAWLTSATWLLRSNFAAELFGGRRFGMTPSLEQLVDAGDGGGPDERVRAAVDVLLDGAIGDASRRALARFSRSAAAQGPGGLAAVFHAVSDLPEAQLL